MSMDTGRRAAGPDTMETLTLTLARRLLPALRRLDATTVADGGPWEREHWLKDLPDKWEYSRVARDEDGAVIGFIVASRKPGSAHVHRVVVAGEKRGEGIGTELVRSVARSAASAEVPAVTLKVHVDNRRARALYERLGFEVEARTGDSHLMRATCERLLAPRG